MSKTPKAFKPRKEERMSKTPKAFKPRKEDSKLQRQELFCHNCNRYVQFDIDITLEGNHVLNCPNCGHEHCRVVRNGQITDDRWGQRNGNTYQAVCVTTSVSSVTSANVSYSTTTSSCGIGTSTYYF